MKTTIVLVLSLQNFDIANMPPCHAELEKSLRCSYTAAIEWTHTVDHLFVFFTAVVVS